VTLTIFTASIAEYRYINCPQFYQRAKEDSHIINAKTYLICLFTYSMQ